MYSFCVYLGLFCGGLLFAAGMRGDMDSFISRYKARRTRRRRVDDFFRISEHAARPTRTQRLGGSSETSSSPSSTLTWDPYWVSYGGRPPDDPDERQAFEEDNPIASACNEKESVQKVRVIRLRNGGKE